MAQQLVAPLPRLIDEPPQARPAATKPAATAATAGALSAHAVVQVAAYRDADRAEQLATQLRAKGYAAEARREAGVYRVVVSALTADLGSDTLRRLRQEGYNGFFFSR